MQSFHLLETPVVKLFFFLKNSLLVNPIFIAEEAFFFGPDHIITHKLFDAYF